MGNKLFHIESRRSDSPLIDKVWHSHSQQAGDFLSTAASRLELVVSRWEGQLYCTVRGPETVPSLAQCPPEGEWLGIQFKHGVFLPKLPTSDLVDGNVDLPQASARAFWLHGSAWEFPNFDNADTFIARLVKEELLVCDTVVTTALQNHATDLSPRTVERRFLRATGLTHSAISQIERAHHAVSLLQDGVSILDTVELAGYYDQPHLSRTLKRLIGLTPAQLLAQANPMPLSIIPNPE
jgi:AraC-like DNA-binding protein